MPVEALQRTLANADDQDDRVWLGRGNQAILTGRFAEAAVWLDRALKARPEDEAVWQAKRALAQATDDIPGLREAARHLFVHPYETRTLHSLRVWLADRLGQHEVERRELLELIRVAPGDARARAAGGPDVPGRSAARGRGAPPSQGRGGQGPGSRPEDSPRSRYPRACRGTLEALPGARPGFRRPGLGPRARGASSRPNRSRHRGLVPGTGSRR